MSIVAGSDQGVFFQNADLVTLIRYRLLEQLVNTETYYMLPAPSYYQSRNVVKSFFVIYLFLLDMGGFRKFRQGWGPDVFVF